MAGCERIGYEASAHEFLDLSGALWLLHFGLVARVASIGKTIVNTKKKKQHIIQKTLRADVWATCYNAWARRPCS